MLGAGRGRDLPRVSALCSEHSVQRPSVAHSGEWDGAPILEFLGCVLPGQGAEAMLAFLSLLIDSGRPGNRLCPHVSGRAVTSEAKPEI